MWSADHDTVNVPRATRYLNRRVLCGLCRYGCCHGVSLNVECTPAEAATLQLPVVFPQNGDCRCVTPTGCVHGESRPMGCKLFPLTVKRGALVVAHWSLLNCPTADDYELVSQDVRGYHYRRKVLKSEAKRNNSLEAFTLDAPIITRPTVLEICREAVVAYWGAVGWATIRRGLRVLNGLLGG